MQRQQATFPWTRVVPMIVGAIYLIAAIYAVRWSQQHPLPSSGIERGIVPTPSEIGADIMRRIADR